MLRQGDLPRLNLQVNRGSDFAAWQAQWDSYMSLSRLSAEFGDKQVQALTLCFSHKTLTIVQNLGLDNEERKQGRMQNLVWVGSFQEKVDLFDGAGVQSTPSMRSMLKLGACPPRKI